MIIGIDASRVVRSHRTGTEVYAYELLAALLPMAVAAGYQVRLYFNEPPLKSVFPDFGQSVQQVVIPFRRLWTHLRLAYELHRHPPDLFFTPAHVIPWTYRGLSVATVHDLGYHYFPEAHTRWQVVYLNWSTRHNVHRARLVLADSQATGQDVIRWYGGDGAKVRVVYPGRQSELKRVEDAGTISAIQQKYNITSPYLLYLGTVQPRKNLVRLVQAYAMLPEHDYQLVIAGKLGWLATPILEAIRALPKLIQQKIILAGYIPEEDKAALLSGATALLYPSLYEGFGFPILEAQACGTPVLCADNSSLPEVAGMGALQVKAEDVVEMSAGIHRLLTDHHLRQQLIQQGYANLQRFSWTHAAQQLLELFQEIIPAPTLPPTPLSILNVPIHPITMPQTVSLVQQWMQEPHLHQITTINPEFVMAAQQDEPFCQVLQTAQLCLPDGIGLVWASHWYAQKLPERVPGSELVYLLAEKAAQQGWRLFLLGAAEGVAAEAGRILQQRYPGLIIAGSYSGSPSPDENDQIIQQINDSRANLLYVAYGAPKQDLWIARNRQNLAHVRVAMGVGGALDFITGKTTRAPQWMQQLGLEWLHRLYKQPWRWRRMLALPQFAWQAWRASHHQRGL